MKMEQTQSNVEMKKFVFLQASTEVAGVLKVKSSILPKELLRGEHSANLDLKWNILYVNVHLCVIPAS